MANPKHDPLEAAKSKVPGTAPAVAKPPLPPAPSASAGAPDAPVGGNPAVLPPGTPAEPPAGTAQGPKAPDVEPSNDDPEQGPALPPIPDEPVVPAVTRVFRCVKSTRMSWSGVVLAFVKDKEYTEKKLGPAWADHVDTHMKNFFERITP
jgi:hypothetical protein